MNILLVDDHSLFRQGLEMLLTQSNNTYNVFHAENGNDALEIIKQKNEIDLVILDYNLANGLGIDVLVRVKAHDPSIPISMISGDDNPRQIQQSLDLGANGYILKNMDTSEIISAINSVLEGNLYVPDDVLAKLNQNDDEQDSNIKQIADLARNVVYNQDLSIRAEDVEDTPCGLVSAFNSLLDQLHGNQQQLQNMAFRDELTGLYNRRYFIEQLEQSQKKQLRSGKPFALVYMDLDKFKQINDTLGHDAGDDLLKEVARRLLSSTREVDVVARLGGDEFTMILSDIDNRENTQIYLDRLIEKLREPLMLANTQCNPSISIGAALSSKSLEIKDLMKLADKALYKVKEAGRNNISIH